MSLIDSPCNPSAASSASLASSGKRYFHPKTYLRSNLKRSVLDGVYFGVMVGIGETYIPAFALAVGLGEVVSGLVVSVPMLIGGIAQLISLRAIDWFGSYRRWILVTSAIQSLAFIPLIVAACTGTISAFWLFFVVSVYWGSGMASGPAWNSWIGSVVPPSIRSHFFARRTRLIQLATFSGFLAGGGLLYLMGRSHWALVGFGLLFSIAMVARVISVSYLGRHRVNEGVDHLPLRSPSREVADRVLERVDTGDVSSRLGWRLVTYLATMQIFVQFSGPFFVPYMLKKLTLGYEYYVLLVGCAFVGKAVSMPLWGAIANRKGGKFLLTLGGIGVIPLAAMWTVSDHLAWLIFVQSASGVLWAGYELGFFLVFLNDIPLARRAKLMTIYNFANSAAWCVGSLLGGWLLASQGAAYHAYHVVFWLSSLGRLACLGLLWNIHRVHSPAPFWRFKQTSITKPKMRATQPSLAAANGSSPVASAIQNADQAA